MAKEAGRTLLAPKQLRAATVRLRDGSRRGRRESAVHFADQSVECLDAEIDSEETIDRRITVARTRNMM